MDKNLNKTVDKIFNIDFYSTKSFSKNKEDNNNNKTYNNDNKLKLGKEKKNNKFSSNKLQKHINYYEKYFNTNSNNYNDEHTNNNNEEKKSDIKSSIQSIYYPGNKSIRSSINNVIKPDLNKNYFNSGISYHENSTRLANIKDKFSNLITYNDGDSYFIINKNMNSFRSVQRPFYLNENMFFKHNNNKNKEEDELSKTIIELKNNILKKEKYSYIIFEKIKILTKITFCFFRYNNKNETKFNPMNKISNENLCKSPYFFMKSSISLNNSYEYIRIGLTTKLDPIDISVKDIRYTVVSSSMKKIIEIYRDCKKFCKNNDKDLFIKKEMEKNNNLSYEYIKKCIDNKKFNFILFAEGNQQMEFIFTSYEDFKMWINGFSYIINNKNKLLELIE
jgi:hypothetical protein